MYIQLLIWVSKLFLGGFKDGDYYNNILEFHPRSGRWTILDKLSEARAGHAVGTVPLQDVEEFCSEFHDIQEMYLV